MEWTWDIFVITALIGMFFFLGQLFLGGGDTDVDADVDTDVDIGDNDVSDHESEAKIFSVRSLFVALTFFGIGGKLSMYFEVGFWISVIIGLASALVAAWIVYLMMNFLFKQQASSLITDKQFVGLSGIVSTTIGKNSIGEVVVELNGQRKYMPARSKDNKPIAISSTVKIVDVTSGVLIVD